MLSPGDRVKDYEVIAPLRSGGMAMLYLARRRGVGGFSRLVALKLVHPHLMDDETIHRLFLNEARISASVAHPNVVNVEEIGQTGDGYFIAMEYVHGVSLAELLASMTERKLRMNPKLCVWLVAQIAEALHAVHEARGENGVPLQIVHRDVSPQNVLIAHTGHVKLIDFGIAKSRPLGQQVGSGLSVLGKLGYMAPEQLRSEAADRRTDVYALGVMLWEMLTSRSLFRCQGLDDERDWAMREQPAPPSRYAPIASIMLDEVVLKALSYEPSDRFDTAFDFRSALLRADPTAVLLDAPAFAMLMRTMLGHELERQRANLPSEVSVQLDLDAEQNAAHSYAFDELTANISDHPNTGRHELAQPTTLPNSPSAMRSGRNGGATPTSHVAPANAASKSVAPRPDSLPPIVFSTLPPLPPPAAVPTMSGVTPARFTAGVSLVGAVCLGIGMFLGAAASQPDSIALMHRALPPTVEEVRQPEVAHEDVVARADDQLQLTAQVARPMRVLVGERLVLDAGPQELTNTFQDVTQDDDVDSLRPSRRQRDGRRKHGSLHGSKRSSKSSVSGSHRSRRRRAD